jgi:23S rRNA (adenine2030-N6)-methyltransferase
MFSYRHAFHAGNHADVLKHIVWLALLRYLTQKEGLAVIDTHAGAGLYRLDGDHSQTSGEAREGLLRLLAGLPDAQARASAAPLIADYLDLLAGLNPEWARTGTASDLRIYPGSPWIAAQFLGDSHRLSLFEWHPTDFRSLSGNIGQLEIGRRLRIGHADGFEAAPALLPPASRRGLMLCDPSYELKEDYGRVLGLMQEALRRFATGCYALWYPIIPRPQAHELPRRLKTAAQKAERPWLDVTLTVKGSKLIRDTEGQIQRPGLPASGLFIVNPPHTLKQQLETTLPQLVSCLGQDRHAGYSLTSGH